MLSGSFDMARSTRPRLDDMKDHIAFLKRIGVEHTYTDYANNRTLQFACQYAVLVLAEAANHLPPHIRARAPDVPWASIISIGNKLRHEYHRVDPEIIWDIIRNHVHSLEAAVLTRLAAPDID